MRFLFNLLFTVLVFCFGFAAGVYSLPIMMAPPAPTQTALSDVANQAKFTAQFKKDLKGSDFLHFGEGDIFLGDHKIGFEGRLAPGPDYRLYLSPTFVETEAEFEQHKSTMQYVAAVSSFNGFIVEMPKSVNLNEFTTVVIWCESFGEFITAANYR
ncbi:DM13 domain-containing protein [Pseudoalteromonas sp. SMS1]|uniref:DM13 domain-containing protein n=1 Tax=Pseudoalteromonas sp. SMS1 TaxID=2908894 RepID=UPI001F18935D|nr:DM13 domain-containing protein [Pseudoalteromonas sp. SMS1]MCF2859857.1 DM13 domain-containing protein [Pseudoalteromonas sp. SMS1]